MINNEQILMCIYKGIIIIRNRWKSFNTITGDMKLYFFYWWWCWWYRWSLAGEKKKHFDDRFGFYLTRSKHKNYRLFDLLENNDSCDTLIYCFHDKKKERVVKLDKNIFLISLHLTDHFSSWDWLGCFHWSQCCHYYYYDYYIYVCVYIYIYIREYI